MCSLFGKALKQRDTSILFGLIVLTSFCMGHACINVQNAFWKEPVIVWIASVITTGMFFTFINTTKFCHNHFRTKICEVSPNCYYRSLLLAFINLSLDQFMRSIKLCHLVFTQSELVMFVNASIMRHSLISYIYLWQPLSVQLKKMVTLVLILFARRNFKRQPVSIAP